jgi:hypothetical protein
MCDAPPCCAAALANLVQDKQLKGKAVRGVNQQRM